MKNNILSISLIMGCILVNPVHGTLITLTDSNLESPTQAELQSGTTINDFGGFAGFILGVTARGNHDTDISPNITGTSFSNSMPTVNALSEPGYDFTFDGGGAWIVVGVTVSSNNNIFSRNISSTGFRVRERASFSTVGGTWDSIIPNAGGNTGQLQINGVGSADGSISINLPPQNVAFNTSGYNAVATGTSITSLAYTYDLPTVAAGGQAPATLETNQPFSVTIDIVAVPEPSSLLLTLTGIGLLCRRVR